MAKIAMTSDKKIMVLNEGVEGIPSITIDSELSNTSTNPVQNKVIKAAIDAVDIKAENKQDKIGVSGLLKGDGTTISAAVAEIDYMVPPTGGITGQVLKKTETGTEWADGKSAYQSAVEAGYSGTETAFNTALSNVPGHIADGNIHVTAEEKQAWNDSDIFIATYGTTTSAEIEAAYQAGKMVIAKKLGYFAPLIVRMSNLIHVFGSVNKFFQCRSDIWQELTPEFNPSTHASTHASGGSDPITPADIGAATMDEVNAAIQTAIGNAIGGSY